MAPVLSRIYEAVAQQYLFTCYLFRVVCPATNAYVTIFYHLTFETAPNLEGQVPFYISQEQGGPFLPPGNGIPFASFHDQQVF
jgi:hypothetical protein